MEFIVSFSYIKFQDSWPYLPSHSLSRVSLRSFTKKGMERNECGKENYIIEIGLQELLKVKCVKS